MSVFSPFFAFIDNSTQADMSCKGYAKPADYVIMIMK